jgi:hypothetical protein
MRGFYKKLFFLLVLASFPAFAQEDAWVYFTDKQNVAASIANPISILTQAAIDRKNLHGTPIDARDVPVNPSYISQVKSQPGITVFAKSKWFNCVYVRGLQSDVSALANLAFVDSIDFADHSLNSIPKGNFVEPEPKFKLFDTQTDFNYGDTAIQVEMIDADYLHEQGYTGEGITMAVMDAGFPGVDVIAPFQRMRNNNDLLDGYDFVDNVDNEFAFSGSSHGTAVLSTITGFVQDQFVGTAPDVSVYLFRTEDVDSETPVEMAYWVEAAERADSLGVYLLSTSLGYSWFDDPSNSFQPSDMDGETTFISRGATLAFEKGMLVVNSAGNSGSSSWGIITAPADSPGALAIGAVDDQGNYASFSSTGPSADGRVKPDVVAQGQSAAVIGPSGNIGTSSGTSFSAPIMAGAIVSLWQADPSKTNLEIMDAVRQSASQYNNPDNFLGYGIPNFQTALADVLSVEENIAENGISVYPNPVGDQLHIENSNPSKNIEIQLFSLLGRKLAEFQNPNTIDFSSFESGVYLLKIISGNEVSTEKIIKK